MGVLNRQHSAENRAPNPGGKGGGGAGTPERPASMLGTGSRVFGLYDRVACSVCGQDTYLRRRSPHTSDSDAYEFQTFSCRTCNASTPDLLTPPAGPVWSVLGDTGAQVDTLRRVHFSSGAPALYRRAPVGTNSPAGPRRCGTPAQVSGCKATEGQRTRRSRHVRAIVTRPPSSPASA
jgi:hypothetical protein